ncbi:sigma-54-dependent transcriptional regulator [Nitrincola alkalisediminis]|uniref:sigma-54-dependent transcriptional regulator n=1 Tax=Nitrincola alkalisediminis TaxID=1366656 RepID=UPI001876C991|nr:sigma-54 dependent transcriptional regulator [Nitrincola alkalisediminis]
MSRILIVEDEQVIREALKRLLVKHQYSTDCASNVNDAETLMHAHAYDLIISDLRLPGRAGTDLIGNFANIPVLIMTSYASMRSAIDAMKLGAVDYVAKPFDHDEMLNTISKLIRTEPVLDDTLAVESDLITGECDAVVELRKRINKVAQTDATVLILGESGTGKELAARSIHQKSQRSSAPMISVNCAAIPDSLIESELFGHEKGAFTGADTCRSGLIEAADKGTLFLDEIGELPLEAQARLLRFLQEGEIRRVGAVHARKVNVRLIAATHRDLKAMASEGRFREDLYYRLYVMELNMPALRERGDDIVELARIFLSEQNRKHNAKLEFSAASLQAIKAHLWPGNVRELQNAIERAVILAEGPLITPDILGLKISAAHTTPPADPIQTQKSLHEPKPDLSLDDYFQRYVLENQDSMNETDLAKNLGISRKCLWERRQKLGIPRKPKKESLS